MLAGEAYACEGSRLGDRGDLPYGFEAVDGGVNGRGGIWSDHPSTWVCRGVAGGCASLTSISSFDILREVSVIRGDEDSLDGVPPPSESDRVLFVRGDMSWMKGPDRPLATTEASSIE